MTEETKEEIFRVTVEKDRAELALKPVETLEPAKSSQNIANVNAGDECFKNMQDNGNNLAAKNTEILQGKSIETQQRGSTILAVDERSLAGSRDSADLQHLYDISVVDRDNKSALTKPVQAGPMKVVRTQHLKLALNNHQVQHSQHIVTDRSQSPDERRILNTSRCRDLTPISTQNKRNKNKQPLWQKLPTNNQVLLELSPRSINIHQQANILVSKEEKATTANNRFPQRKVKKLQVRTVANREIDFEESLSPREYGSRDSVQSKSRGSPSPTLALNSDIDSAIAHGQQQHKIGSPQAKSGVKTVQRQPDFKSFKQSLPAFITRQQKRSAVNVKVRSHTRNKKFRTQINQVIQTGGKLQILQMPVIKQVDSNFNVSQDTRMFGSTFYRPDNENAIVNIDQARARIQSQQRNQRLQSINTEALQSMIDQNELSKVDHSSHIASIVKTQASDQNLRCVKHEQLFQRFVINNEQQSDSIKEERATTSLMAKQDIAEAVTDQQPSSAPAEHAKKETNSAIKTNVDVESSLIKSTDSQAEPNCRESMSQHRSSIMIQNNSYENQKEGANSNEIDKSTQSVDSQNRHLEVTIKKISEDKRESREETSTNENNDGGRQSTPLEAPELLATTIVTQTNVNQIQKSSQISSFQSTEANEQEISNQQQKPKEDGIEFVETVIWSPQSTKKLKVQDVWNKKGQNPAQQVQSKQHPAIVDKMSSENKSLYTADRERTKKLYTNFERIAQILDPNEHLTEMQRRKLPEDKTNYARLKNSLTNTLRPRAVQNNEVKNLTLGQLDIQRSMLQTTHGHVYQGTMMRANMQMAYQRMPKTPQAYIQSVTPNETNYNAQSNARSQLRHNSKPHTTRRHGNLFIQQVQAMRNSRMRSHIQQHQNIVTTPRSKSRSGSPLTQSLNAECGLINFGNLADQVSRAGSRMQKQVEELQVLQSHEQNSSLAVRESKELPPIANTVKEWLTQQDKDLILVKYQNVHTQRVVGKSETYKGKKRSEAPQKTPLRIDLNDKINMNASPSRQIERLNYRRQDTLKMKKQQSTIRHDAQNDSCFGDRTHQFAQSNILTQNSNTIHESPLDMNPKMIHQTSRNNQTNNDLINMSFTQKSATRAISPKGKKNLYINLPVADDSKPYQTKNGKASQRMIQTDVGSRAGISVGAAYTIEAMSHEDVSEENSLYKSGNNRTVTLNMVDQFRGVSPDKVSQSPLISPSLIQNDNDFQIKVVSQRVNINNENLMRDSSLTRRSQSPQKTPVPRIRGFTRPLQNTTSTEQKNLELNADLQIPVNPTASPFPLDQSIKAPLTVRQKQETEVSPNASPRPAPLITARQNTLDNSSKECDSNPSHRQSLDMGSQIAQRLQSRGDVVSIDTDRKILLNCLAVDSQSGKVRKDSTVLTRLLKGQEPTLKSYQQSQCGEDEHLMLNLEEVSYLKKTALESNSNLQEQSFSQPQTTMLFHLNTLYSMQTRTWQKYDEQWAQFDKDHLKCAAPIPTSTQFLLVHLIQQLGQKRAYKRLTFSRESPMFDRLNSADRDSEIASFPSSPMSNSRACSPDRTPKSTNTNAKGIGHGIIKLGKQIKTQKNNTQNGPQVSKVPGTDYVTPQVLEEAYRQARVRLQMAQGSLLFKFNDDDRRIFAQLKAQLTETFEKLQRSSSCRT